MNCLKIPRTLRLPAMLVVAAQSGTALADTAGDAASAAVIDRNDILVIGQRPAVNPYGDAEAPFKVDRLAGEKFVVPLVDLPRTVTVIPKEVIEDQGALSFRDLVRVQPGITLGTGEGGNAFGDRTFIRGFDARNDVYIDGFRDPGVTQREVFAVRQIEVIKGPSATYGGRGTTGGSVNFVTKKPQFGNFAAINGTLGSDDTRRITGDVNFKVNDQIQVRVDGLFQFGHVAGRREVWNKRWGVFASAVWRPVEGVEITGDYYHLNWTSLPDWGLPFDARTQQPFSIVSRKNWYGVKARDFMHTGNDIGTLKGSWDIGENVTLTTTGRYSTNINKYIASAPEAPIFVTANPALSTVAANPKSRNADGEFYGNMTTLRVDFETGPLSHKLVFGAEWFRERVINRPFSQAQSEVFGAPIVPAVAIRPNLFFPDPNIPWVGTNGLPLVAVVSGAKTDAKITSKAAYFLDNIEITPELQVSAGLRYDDFRLKLYNIAGPTAAVPNPVPLVLTKHDNFFNWNAGVVYKPVPRVSLYVSAATSSNPSGEQTDSVAAAYGGLSLQSVDLSPEKNRAYEIGAKWEAGGHLLLTAALFRTTKTNARVLPTGAPGTTPLQLVGKQRVQGVELGASGNITPAWSVYGGFVYLDSEVVTAFNPGNVGQMFPNIPKRSGSLLTTYAITPKIKIGGQASYYSKRFGGSNLSNAAGITNAAGVVVGNPSIPAYWRFDASARFEVTDRLELQINALNLTNKRYFEALYQSATPFSYLAPGFSVLSTLRLVL